MLAGATRAGVVLDRAALRELVREDEQGRFALGPDGGWIRAMYGHSMPVDAGAASAAPPARLYHGTATRFLEGVRRSGLRAGRRRHVHRSSSPGEARRVGLRHGVPVVLEADAARMRVEGLGFHHPCAAVWITACVPPRFPTRA